MICRVGIHRKVFIELPTAKLFSFYEVLRDNDDDNNDYDDGYDVNIDGDDNSDNKLSRIFNLIFWN